MVSKTVTASHECSCVAANVHWKTKVIYLHSETRAIIGTIPLIKRYNAPLFVTYATQKVVRSLFNVN